MIVILSQLILLVVKELLPCMLLLLLYPYIHMSGAKYQCFCNMTIFCHVWCWYGICFYKIMLWGKWRQLLALVFLVQGDHTRTNVSNINHIVYLYFAVYIVAWSMHKLVQSLQLSIVLPYNKQLTQKMFWECHCTGAVWNDTATLSQTFTS